MVSFSWLHLTDLHRGMKEQHWLWPGVREIFFEDLKKLHKKCGPWDLVLFTGDLTQCGSAEEFRKVNELLEELWEQFKALGSSPRLLAVPGNHDLVRPDKKEPSMRLLQKWGDLPDIQREFWEEPDSPYRNIVVQAFEHYTAWWKKQAHRIKDVTSGILPGDFSTTIEKEGVQLGIMGLNTSFLQLTGDNYEGKLALHTRQFHEACGGDGPKWAARHQACLLLTHHPPAWLTPNAQQHLYGEITAHGRFMVHLCGHTHETAYREFAEGGAEARRIWQGHSLFGLEYFGEHDEGQRLHGYTAGKITLRGKTGTLLLWPREARLQGWQRSIVPDYSVALTDDQHTHPRDVELIKARQKPQSKAQSSAKAPDSNSFQYDIFLSYNSKDRDQTEKIASWLRDQGIRVWFDKWCLVPGLPWQEGLERGLQQSRIIAVFLGSFGFGQWGNTEMRAAVNLGVKRKKPVVLIYLPDCPEEPEIPIFIEEYTWLDFRGGLEDQEARGRLIWAITGENPYENV